MPRTRASARRHSNQSSSFAIAILAAGKGTRLKSNRPKVLHEIGGKPLLAHVIAAAARVVAPQNIFAIIGHEAEAVRAAVQSTGVGFVLQREQRGTGHAMMEARAALESFEHVLVLSGDVPLITPATIARVRDFHIASRAAMTVLTAEVADPTGYGRIFRRLARGGQTDEVERIVEQSALRGRQKEQREINSGIYAFATGPLYRHIGKLGTANPHHEYYLTDIAERLRKSGEKVMALRADDPEEVVGVNTRIELAELDARLRARKARELMLAGTTIFRPKSCDIDSDVEVGADTVIEPFVQLIGRTKIGSNCRIRSYSVITNCQIGDNVLILPGCFLEDSTVRSGAQLGPYSRLRPGCDIGEGAKVGNFVETKKTRLGRGSKANHLSYLGDAEIGEGVNVGAGTITCNYDGAAKNRTIIEDGVFVGSDTSLVAPVRIGRGAYIGAGSCITEDVPEDALALARGRQVNKEGWARERRARMRPAAK
ncbi:MAG TPA: bifunctional UDP-N-acetylglucosamine diphosphorylase/glucosamine-1-phosphate N-acetyltransferase GlmU [Candidatus Binatia bacterium]|nr:bifunctional UDP-N-acetylglucosamine diphosphorylase/glucosamine-1-phosphate N-acetyltransferase GlmU [Candidatus Binatia bacterium]